MEDVNTRRDAIEASALKIVDDVATKFREGDSDPVPLSGSFATGAARDLQKSLLLRKSLLPEPLTKEEDWHRYQAAVQDYFEEVRSGMKAKLEEIHPQKQPITA